MMIDPIKMVFLKSHYYRSFDKIISTLEIKQIFITLFKYLAYLFDCFNYKIDE